jgi:hypothetical protein
MRIGRRIDGRTCSGGSQAVKVRNWLAALGSELHALGAGPTPGRLVAWLGGVFIVVVVALAGYDIVRSYQATVEQIRVDLDTQSRVIAEQSARAVQAIDTVLRHLAEQSRRDRSTGSRSSMSTGRRERPRWCRGRNSRTST